MSNVDEIAAKAEIVYEVLGRYLTCVSRHKTKQGAIDWMLAEQDFGIKGGQPLEDLRFIVVPKELKL